MGDLLNKVRDFIEKEAPPRLKDWSHYFLPPESTVFSPDRCALRIGSDRISLLHTRKTEKKAEILYSKTSSYTYLRELAPLLEKWVEEEGLKGVRTTWILEPEQYQLLQTEALPVAPAEFQAAIRWKVKDQLGYPVEDSVIDHFALPRAKLPISLNLIMLVIARLSIIKPFSEAVKESGLKLTTIDIPELCFRNLAALYEPDEKSTAFIYLKDEAGYLMLTQKEQFYFSRPLATGLRRLTAAEKMGARELEQVMNDFALDVQRSFDYYQSQWRQAEPSRVLIETAMPCGFDITTLLGQRLNASVSALPLDAYFTQLNRIDPKERGYYLPLLGSVIREWEHSYAAGN